MFHFVLIKRKAGDNVLQSKIIKNGRSECLKVIFVVFGYICSTLLKYDSSVEWNVLISKVFRLGNVERGPYVALGHRSPIASKRKWCYYCPL